MAGRGRSIESVLGRARKVRRGEKGCLRRPADECKHWRGRGGDQCCQDGGGEGRAGQCFSCVDRRKRREERIKDKDVRKERKEVTLKYLSHSMS